MAAGKRQPGVPDWERINQDSFTQQAEALDRSAFFQGPREVGTLARLAELHPDHELLDVACGTGAVLLSLAPHVRHATGLDLTPAMLAVARAKAPANVTLVEGRADIMMFADGQFDVVVNRLAMHHFSDAAACLREIVRVLRPGGRLVLGDLYCSVDPTAAALCNEIERYRDPSHVCFYSAARLRAMVEAEGLEVVEEERWETPRALSEWAGITAPSGGIPRLREMMTAAIPGDTADMAIAIRPDGDIHFIHRWLCLAARKPS